MLDIGCLTWYSSNPNCDVLSLSGAKRDADGYLWITGRIDDMLNVSGHLLSTADVESVLIEHPLVAETAVVAHPHSIKGECLYCFVTLKDVSLCLCLKFITIVHSEFSVKPWPADKPYVMQHYIKFRVKNAEALKSLCRHFQIYRQNKLQKGRQEQMRF